ncbi:MAG: phosphatase PAP2 family protein [Cyanobacteria bacterium J06560_2]
MRRKKTPLLAYGLVSLALAALSSAVYFERVFPIDIPLLEAIHRLESTPMNWLMVGITRLGDPLFTVPAVFIIFALLRVQKHRSEAEFFALNCLGGAVLSTGLKLIFGKARPALWDSPIVETTFSYPSGHALGSVVLYGFLAYLWGRRVPQHRGWIYGGAIALCLAIGFSRLYLGVHWPTDLIGGYIIGFLWTSSCILLLKRKSPATA